MGQKSIQERFPSYYRQDLLEWQRLRRGWSKRATADKAEISKETVKKVLKGQATSTKVYPVAKALGVDWVQLHNLKLQEADFHLAVRNGAGQVKGRSDLGRQHRP